MEETVNTAEHTIQNGWGSAFWLGMSTQWAAPVLKAKRAQRDSVLSTQLKVYKGLGVWGENTYIIFCKKSVLETNYFNKVACTVLWFKEGEYICRFLFVFMRLLLCIVRNWWEEEIMQRGDCFDNRSMLSHLYFISSGTTVKLWQAFQDVLAQFWVLFYEGYLHKASTWLEGPVSCFVIWITLVIWKFANICCNSKGSRA